MAGQTDQRPSETGVTPVPDLIERYRLHRDAWIAQADELARLRDEVRGSAEREAMEIVTAARRDVRKVIMEARRELLVLSAQVQAALGEAAVKTDPTALLNKAGITPDDQSPRPSLSGSTPERGFAPETAVTDILNEVHGDMAALAEDARALPLQVVPPARTVVSPPAPPAPPEVQAPAPPRPAQFVIGAMPAYPAEPPREDSPALSPVASALRLSWPGEAVPVLEGRRLKLFVGLLVLIGVVVVGATTWWLSSPEPSEGPPITEATASNQPADDRRVDAPLAAPSPQPDSAEPEVTARTVTPAGKLVVVAEAVRDVWVRTTIDGRTDQGRTLVAGQVIDIAADQSISLRAGDAGAIVVSVNRGPKRPLGPDGQAMTREFAAGAPAGGAAPNRAPAAAPVTPPPVRTIERGPTLPPTVAAPPAQTPSSVPPTAAVATPSAAVVPSAVPTQVRAPSPAPRPESSGAGATISPATAVVAAARQWLDAYHRQDRAAMAALSTENLLLADERRSDERIPSGTDDVRRTLDRVSVQIAADTAVLTAVMTEQSNALPVPRVSPVSQVWVLAGGGQWKVRQARFVSEARLNQVFR